MRSVAPIAAVLAVWAGFGCSRRVLPTMTAACQRHGRPGPLQFPIARDGRCLIDATGAPVWLHGEAAWSLLVRLTDDEVERYLADREARGVNALLVNLIEHKFADDPPKNRAGVAPFTTPHDFTTPNEAYFAHVDHVLARAAAHHMVVMLAPSYLGHDGGEEGWYVDVIRQGTDAMRTYGRFLGARYHATANLIWVEGGDMPPEDAADAVDALVAGIQESDRAHLHTAHTSRQRSALDDYARPWLDVNTTYSDCDRHAQKLRADALRDRAIPTIFIEGTYEGEQASLDCTISQAYRTLLSGAVGHVFGNRPIWLFDPGWADALASPGSRAMEHLAALLASRDLHGLVPDFAGPASIAVARTWSNDTLLMFGPGERSLLADTKGLAPTQLVAWWYDTEAGTARDAGSFAAGGKHELEVPPGGPWLLVIEDAAVKRPPPGTR